MNLWWKFFGFVWSAGFASYGVYAHAYGYATFQGFIAFFFGLSMVLTLEKKP